MKHSKIVSAITVEYKLNKKETVSTMEAVGFVNINEQIVKSSSPLAYHDLLNWIATENNLDCMFSTCFMCGDAKDTQKAMDILTNSVKFN